MTARLLILAGTAEARRLAIAAAQREGWETVASLAGATAAPTAYPCRMRIGGFGGADGLARYLSAHRLDAVIDATHPFATRISANAAAAARATGTPLLRLTRPPWAPSPALTWKRAADLDAADRLIPAGARAFLAVGRDSLAPFAARRDYWRAARVVDPPDAAPPFAPGIWVIGRPPFDVEAERRLFTDLGITHLAAKNAGGEAGWAKLAAAADLGIEIAMVDRPSPPPAETVYAVEAALDWLDRAQARIENRDP